jgi:hypothetical protein
VDLQQPQQLDSKALFDLIFHNVIAPSNGTELTIYYLIWIVAYLLINIIWDIKTDKTPKFFISGISNKQNLLHQAASLPSNILIIVACINPIVWELAKEIKLPLLISGISALTQRSFRVVRRREQKLIQRLLDLTIWIANNPATAATKDARTNRRLS